MLRNTRHEQYAQFRAGGKSAAQAYALAGFKGKGAAQSGNRLDRDAKISARIKELVTLAQNIPTAAHWLSRNYVLDGLRQVFEKAMAESNLSSAVRALELMGKELGMFVDRTDHTFHWDGDPSKLEGTQLEKLTLALETLAFGGDAAAARAAERRALMEAGVVEIQAVAETDYETPTEEAE